MLMLIKVFVDINPENILISLIFSRNKPKQ